MSRVLIYNLDGSIASVTDTSAPSGSSTSGSTGTTSGSSGPSNGATGVISASSITNSGTTTLNGNLSVASNTTLSGATTVNGLTNNSTSTLKGDTSVTGSVIASAALQGATLSTTGNATVGGTLNVNGAATLSGSTNVAALTASGLVTAANLKLSSGGVVTFADGTTQSTAPNASGGTVPVAALGSFSMAIGPYGALSSVTLSATPTPIQLATSASPNTYTPVANSAFMGLYAYSNTAATLSLYDTTAGANVYSVSIAAGKNISAGAFDSSLYPLIAGHTYQWQATGSGTAGISLEPFYLTPSSSPGLCVGLANPMGFSTATTFTGTAVNVPPFGQPAAFGIGNHVTLRTAGVYSAQATYWPSGGTPSTASVTPVLWYGNLSTGAAVAATGITFSAVYATGLPQTILTPRLTDTTSLVPNYFYYWKVSGSGTGTIAITLMPLV